MFLPGDVVASAVGIHLLVTQEAPESHLPNAKSDSGARVYLVSAWGIVQYNCHLRC